MKTKSIIFLLLFVIFFAMANSNLLAQHPLKKRTRKTADSTMADSLKNDEILIVSDSLAVPNDTTKMDSLQKAIYKHNRQVDDSIRLDSIQRAKANGIEAPVIYAAEDSLVYNAQTKTAYMYGTSKVDYQNMNLNSDKIYMSLDSSIVRATGSADTTAENGIKGKPKFKMGQDEYESDTMAFNFKSKRGLIKDVYTEQQDGFMKGEMGKRDSTGTIYLKHARYTTCNDPHPDFYIALSRAKVRPGKDVVFGPAYLVVADVPLPLAIPYGFFPFTKSYSSGFIMPSYGDEQTRGFYLHNGGYYFAINDKWDLKLLGEIYTKGSWGVSATSNYRKRYKYSGTFMASYQDSRTGDKGMPDYVRAESFKIQWNHRQDTKANPFNTLSASVNFATSSYERNNLYSMYNPQAMTQSTRTSSVAWSTRFSSLGMSINAGFNVAQNMRDSTLSLTLPDLTVNVSQFYPFRRKKMVGSERWYEKISVRYTGTMKNSITTKENRIMKTNIFKDWDNGIQHQIPINANFTLFKYINVNPNFTLIDRMYSKKVLRGWDEAKQQEVKTDTVYGFNNLYNWSLGVSASTKIYGFWIPNRKIFGDKIQAIRHVLTPTVSFTYSPDFSASRYGYYDTYQKTNSDGSVELVEYSPYEGAIYGYPGSGKTQSVRWSLKNNIEMKVKSDKDSTGYKKLSIIDNFGISMSYNAAAKRHRWSDIETDLTLKWWKNYTFNMHARFAMYAYELDDNGKPYVGDHTEFHYGRFPRFQGFSQNISYTLNPEKIKKLFGKGDDIEDNTGNDDEGTDTNIESNIDDTMERGKHGAKRKRGAIAETDENGYMKFSMPWSITFGYSITMRENTSGTFDTKHMRYPYKFIHTLNCSGNVRISDGWNINFASGYDFEARSLSMTTMSLSRDLHCFNMSASVVLHPYTSYNFTFRCNASTLTDALKYDKNSGFSNAVQWY